jgi:hypothetical protein
MATMEIRDIGRTKAIVGFCVRRPHSGPIWGHPDPVRENRKAIELPINSLRRQIKEIRLRAFLLFGSLFRAGRKSH